MAEPALAFWTRLVRLPGFVVVHCAEDTQPNRYRFTIAAEQRLGVRPHCQQVGADVHRTRTRAGLVDLPIGGCAVELRLRVCQFQCPRCATAFTPDVPFLADGAHATERFLERATAPIRGSDVAPVARFFGLPETTLARWYYEFIERRRVAGSTPPKPITRIGIDELSSKKNIGSSSPRLSITIIGGCSKCWRTARKPRCWPICSGRNGRACWPR